MKVVVVTVNYDRAGDTSELIESIKKSDLVNSELLVIDNGSTDDSVAVLKNRFPDIAILETENNLGFASGYNFGMKAALEREAEAVLIINNDTLVPSVFLGPLVQALSHDLKIGAVSPKIYAKDGKTIWWAGGFLKLAQGEYINVGSGKKDNGQFNKIFECDYLTGACILFKSEVLRSVGLFDERFTHTGEDDDLSIRITNANYKLLMIPQSTLIHKVSQTAGGENSPRHLYHLEKYRILLMRKWGFWDKLTPFRLIPLLVWRLGAVFWHSFSLSNIWAMFRGWRDGYYEKLA